MRGSLYAVAPSIASTKYSTCGDVSAAVDENCAVMRTFCAERIVVLSSLACTTLNATTTGFGTLSETAFAAPGVGALASGDASQFAGSLPSALALTRWSERPLYW